MPTATRQGRSIHYTDQGHGPAIVLGHSFLCSGRMWEHQLPLWSASRRVLNVDIAGHGASSPIYGTITLDDLVADFLAVLDDAGVERATWCGLSLGGMLSMRAAVTQPARVDGLILMDTDAGAEDPWRKLRYTAMGLGARVVGLRPFLMPIARLMFGDTTRRERPALVRAWKEEFARAHIPSMWACLRLLARRPSQLPELGRIELPALVLVGAEDRSLPPACSRRIHERIAGAEFVEIEGAGHLAALERPERVSEAVLGFLRRRLH